MKPWHELCVTEQNGFNTGDREKKMMTMVNFRWLSRCGRSANNSNPPYTSNRLLLSFAFRQLKWCVRVAVQAHRVPFRFDKKNANFNRPYRDDGRSD